MPKLVYDVVFEVDSSQPETVAKKIDKALSGKGRKNRKNVADELNTSLLRASNTAELTGKKIKDMAADANSSFSVAQRGANSFAQTMQNTNRQVGKGNKRFAAANQLIFSFSDGIQDAAQFGQSFGAGMRAVGNNISFTAELLGVTSRKAKEAGVTMKDALWETITPVNGAILALNLALTLGQLAFDKWGNSAKKAKTDVDKLKDSIVTLTPVIERVSEFLFDAGVLEGDQFGIAQTEDQIERTKQRLKELRSVLDQYTLSAEESARIEELRNKNVITNSKILGEITTSTNQRTEAEERELEMLLSQQKAESQLTEAIAQQRAEIIRTEQNLDDLIEKQRENRTVLMQVTRELMLAASAMGELSEISPLEISVEYGDVPQIDTTRAQQELRKQEALFSARIQLSEGFEKTRMSLVRERIDMFDRLRAADVSREKAQELSLAVFKKNLRDAELENFRSKEAEKLQIIETSAKLRADIEKNLAASTERVNKQAVMGIQSVIQALIPSAKGSALALLGIQKALSIGRVIAEGTEKVAQLRAEQAKATGQASVAFASGNFIQGSALSAAAGAIEGSIGAVKTTTAINAAKIAAIGLAEGAAISIGGGGSSGGSGSQSGSSGNSGIISSSDVERPTQSITFNPRSPQASNQGMTVQVVNTFDKKTAAKVVREGETQIKNSQKKVVTSA